MTRAAGIGGPRGHARHRIAVVVRPVWMAGVATVAVLALTAGASVTPVVLSPAAQAAAVRERTLSEVRAAAAGQARAVKAEQEAPEPVAEVTLRPDEAQAITADGLGVTATFSAHELPGELTVTVGAAAPSAARSAVAETAGVLVSEPVEYLATAADGADVTEFPAEPVNTRGGEGEAPVVSDVVPGVTLELAVDAQVIADNKLDSSTLQIYTREQDGDPWTVLPSYYDEESKTVKGESDHLSQFVVIGTPFPVPPGPAIVLDPDNDEAVVETPGPATEMPYNMALANGLKSMLVERCNAVVTITNPTGVAFVSRETRAAIAAAANPVATLGLAFNALDGYGWGDESDGGSHLYSRGGGLDQALTAELIGNLPAYTTRPAKEMPADADFPHPEFSGVSGAFTHLETLFLDHNYDRVVIDNGFSSIVNGVFTGLGKYLESQGYDCTDPVTGGWPTPPSDAEKARWRHLGYQNYQLYGADPVSFSTGNLLEDEPIFTLDGLGSQVVDLTLIYNSQDGRLARTGAGWSFGLGGRAQRFIDGSVMVVRGDGASFVFNPDGAGGYTGEDALRLQLRAAGAGQLEVTSVTGESWVYDAADIDGIGELVRHTDREGHTTTLGYSTPGAGAQFVPLSSITDAAGQTVTVSADAAGRVASFTHPDGRSWSLGYDGAGNLVSITNPDGRVRSFTYDPEHRMLTATDAAGVVYLVNEYDEQGRVANQWDAEQNLRTFDYSTPGKTSYTDNEGHVTVFSYDTDYRITGVKNAAGDESAYVFDELNQVTEYTDEAGRTWTYTYDTGGNVATETRPDGSVTKYTYTPTGEVASVTDQGGPDGAARSTTFDLDPLGLVTAVHQPDGSTVSNTYTPAGDLASSTTAIGNTSTYGYDGRGNVTSSTDPTGATTSFTYNPANQVTSITDANGHTTTLAWDAGDRLVSSTDPAGAVTSYGYDANDHLTSRTDPTGAVTTYGWDSLFRLVSVTAPDGGATSYAYNREDTLIGQTDPLGATTTFALDELYRATQVTDPGGGVWKRSYDEVGNLLSDTDPNGATTSYDVDVLDRVRKTTDPTGVVNTISYDTAGRVTATADGDGNTTRYQYDFLDRLTGSVDPEGARTDYRYDADGNTLTVIDRLGNTSSMSYDAAGRLISATDPVGATTTYGYDPVGNTTSTIDPLGATTTIAYDAADRPVAVTDPLGAVTTTAYDAMGRVVASTDPNGHTDTAAYDGVGRILSTTDPTGAVTTYGYDLAGRQRSMTDPNGNTTRYVYDPAGQLEQVIEGYEQGAAAGADTNVTTAYRYDAVGNRVGVTDPNGHESTFTFDAAGRVASERNAGGNTWNYRYGSTGRLAEQTDPNGATTRYGYTARGDVASTSMPGKEVSFEYDREQRPIAMTDPLGASGWEYDGAGQLTKQIDANGKQLSYAYDKAGQLASLTMPAGDTIGYQYDTAGRMTSQTSPWGDIAYDWDAAANLLSQTRSTGVVTSYEYDAADRYTAIIHQTPAAKPRPPAAPKTVAPVARGPVAACTGVDNYLGVRTLQNLEGEDQDCVKTWDYLKRRTLPVPENPVADGDQLRYDYAYDPAGNVTTATRTTGATPAEPAAPGAAGTPAGPPAPAAPVTPEAPGVPVEAAPEVQERTFDYDDLNRLTGSTSSTGVTAKNVYDPAGNRTAWSVTGGETNVDVSAVYNELNQLTAMTGTTNASYGYDAAGNRTGQKIDGVGTAFSFDATGRMTGVDRQGRNTSYGYDGLGRQLTSTDTNQYGAQTTTQSWDGTSVVEQDNSARGDTTLMRDVQGELALQAGDATGDRWSLLDRLGSTTAQAAGGSITQLSDYEDWGGQNFETTGWDAAASFTGESSDPGYGLNQYFARSYDPATGTWASQDAWRGLLTEPQSLHRYAYVNNSPARFADADGYRPCDIESGPCGGYGKKAAKSSRTKQQSHSRAGTGTGVTRSIGAMGTDWRRTQPKSPSGVASFVPVRHPATSVSSAPNLQAYAAGRRNATDEVSKGAKIVDQWKDANGNFVTLREGTYDSATQTGFGQEKIRELHGFDDIDVLKWITSTPLGADTRKPGKREYSAYVNRTECSWYAGCDVTDEIEVIVVVGTDYKKSYYGVELEDSVGIMTAYCNNGDSTKKKCPAWASEALKEQGAKYAARVRGGDSSE